MITNRGIDIIARVLAEQTPSAFSYIALGVGAVPVVPPGSPPLEPAAFATKTKLDFEAFRIPVSGASILKEDNQTKVVLTGVLPAVQRYEISEIGVYSAEYNSLLVTEPPRMVYTFSSSEDWEYHSGSTVAEIDYLGTVSDNGIDINSFPGGTEEEAIFLQADNAVFFTANRKNQRMRVYDDSLMLRGDISTINAAGADWALSGNHVHVTGIPLNLARARPTDELKLAFAVVPKTYTDISVGGVPDIVRVAVRFMANEAATEYATMQVEVDRTGTNVTNQSPEDTNFVTNGYYVVSKQKQELRTTTNFSWDSVTMATVWVDVEPQGGHTADQYYIAVDALRFDSNNDNNPTYGLVSYSVIQNDTASTAIKETDIESQLEYKVVLAVSP